MVSRVSARDDWREVRAIRSPRISFYPNRAFCHFVAAFLIRFLPFSCGRGALVPGPE